MDDFNLDNLDGIDFEAAAEQATANSAKATEAQNEELVGMREGANECVGGCTI